MIARPRVDANAHLNDSSNSFSGESRSSPSARGLPIAASVKPVFATAAEVVEDVEALVLTGVPDLGEKSREEEKEGLMLHFELSNRKFQAACSAKLVVIAVISGVPVRLTSSGGENRVDETPPGLHVPPPPPQQTHIPAPRPTQPSAREQDFDVTLPPFDKA